MSRFEEKGGPTPRPDKTPVVIYEVHVHGLELGGTDSGVAQKLDQILTALTALKVVEVQQNERIQNMAGELDALTAEVTRNTEVDNSVVTLVEGLAQKIEELKTNPVALQALADQLRADNDKVAAAVVAHTPAEG